MCDISVILLWHYVVQQKFEMIKTVCLENDLEFRGQEEACRFQHNYV